MTALLACLALACAAPPRSAALSQAQKARITTATGVRLRGEPAAAAAEVGRLQLGVVVRELGRSDAKARVGQSEDYWYRVAAPDGTEGWVFGALTEAYDPARRDQIYRRIAESRLAYAAAGFAELSDTVRFLDRAVKEVKTREVLADLELSRLLALARSFAAIDPAAVEQSPYKSWAQERDKEVVYSEPAGQYFVRSELLWGLQKKYAGLPAAERAAWAAAQNPLPGECEGYLPCMFYAELETSAKYLTLYPRGPHADEAAASIADLLAAVAADAKEKDPVYHVPAEDRAEFRKQLAGLRAALAPVKARRSAEALTLLDAVGRRWR